jgi:hypothetical protein
MNDDEGQRTTSRDRRPRNDDRQPTTDDDRHRRTMNDD